MRSQLFALMAVLAIFMAAPAFALDLDQARNAGLIGEKLDGYVAVLQSTPETEALVKNINQKRRQEYLRISEQNNQPVDVVGKLAAQQIITGLEQGNHYQGVDGIWKTR